jgi:1-acyl-sn-glycerol-3-phosphate acyltransferase
MKKILIFIRSALFSIFSFGVTVPMSILFVMFWLVPFVPERRYKFDVMAARWGELMLWFLNKLTGIKWNVEGTENLEKNKSYIIVGKHESTWETLIMHTFLNPSPIFILKKQLTFVPFMGWCLASVNHIAIDRNAKTRAMIKMIKDAKRYIKRNHSIIIFPQGTRVPIDATVEEYPYKTGFIGLVEHCELDIVPMALNSGICWGKKQFMKEEGIITMRYLKPIPYGDLKGLSKKEILIKIQSIIEPESKKLVEMELERRRKNK